MFLPELHKSKLMSMCFVFPAIVRFPVIVSLQFLLLPQSTPTEIYTLSLHDALPISPATLAASSGAIRCDPQRSCSLAASAARSEEHTSELQSHVNLVCRLLLEKKNSSKLRCYCFYIHICLAEFLISFKCYIVVRCSQ